MNRRLFSLLGLSAALLILAALATNWFGPQQASAPVHGKLLPILTAERANIDHISLSSNGKLLVELKRQWEQWGLANRDGYPANAGTIRTLLDNLSSAEKREAKTADPSRYDKLGVDEQSDKSLLLTLGAGERRLADLIVGNAVSRPVGHFVRLKDDSQSWLIDRELNIGKDIGQWLRTDLLNLPATQVKQVERLQARAVQCKKAPCLPVPGEREFLLSKAKPDDTAFTLEPIPHGKEPGATWLLAGLSDALNNLTASDVLKQDAFDFANAKVSISRFTSVDDQIVLLHHFSKDDKHYVTLGAEAGPAATEAVQQLVAELNQRHAGWLYEIYSYKGEGLGRDLNALVQSKTASN